VRNAKVTNKLDFRNSHEISCILSSKTEHKSTNNIVNVSETYGIPVLQLYQITGSGMFRFLAKKALRRYQSDMKESFLNFKVKNANKHRNVGLLTILIEKYNSH
jgi:hypothetical protein